MRPLRDEDFVVWLTAMHAQLSHTIHPTQSDIDKMSAVADMAVAKFVDRFAPPELAQKPTRGYSDPTPTDDSGPELFVEHTEG